MLSSRLLYRVTIVLSAILVFAIQPIFAKAILPRFGGSAGVWIACMLFFQTLLLAGYAYAYALTRYFAVRKQITVHLVLVAASLCLLPARLHGDAVLAHPATSIFWTLLISIGPLYFLLCSTSPLLQSWIAGASDSASAYPLYAWSNAASIVTLLAYPSIIEPGLSGSLQLLYWSVGYGVAMLLIALTALQHRVVKSTQPVDAIGSATRPILWIALAACSSALWMAVSNHLSQEVAPIPALWVLPLSLYLLSFSACFQKRSWYRRPLFRLLLPAACIAAAYEIAGRDASGGLLQEMIVFSAALFVWCMFCHGELERTKPEQPDGLSFFYLMIALGGALGGIFVGVIAPNAFSTFLELPIGIVFCGLLALSQLYGVTSPKRLARLYLVAAAAFIATTYVRIGAGDVVHLRNFYGPLQVSDTGNGLRTLYNGRTLHGLEFLSPERRRLATAYYGPLSGVGQLLQLPHAGERRVGVIGLGAGTVATYGRPGDVFSFYEINPSVIQVASRDFHFLGQSAAGITMTESDGRLALERAPPNNFDVIVLDAFADDSIPVHLMTREAFQAYFRVLHGDGVLAIHLTSRYLDLAPVVQTLARVLGKRGVLIHSSPDGDQGTLAADWALLSANDGAIGGLGGMPFPSTGPLPARIWTDDYSDLLEVIR